MSVTYSPLSRIRPERQFPFGHNPVSKRKNRTHSHFGNKSGSSMRQTRGESLSLFLQGNQPRHFVLGYGFGEVALVFCKAINRRGARMPCKNLRSPLKTTHRVVFLTLSSTPLLFTSSKNAAPRGAASFGGLVARSPERTIFSGSALTFKASISVEYLILCFGLDALLFQHPTLALVPYRDYLSDL